jgi:hypothetical protein
MNTIRRILFSILSNSLPPRTVGQCIAASTFEANGVGLADLSAISLLRSA